MLKKLIAAAFALAFTASSFAAGPAQIWRLEVTRAAEDIVEISEIELREAEGGANVTEMIRTYTHEQTPHAAVWVVNHNQDLREDRSTVTVAAENVLDEAVEPDSITWNDENTMTIVFSVPVDGSMFLRGFTLDTPAANRPGIAVPVVEGIENRPAAAAFDKNMASWFKSKRAPTERSPLAIQYTYWVGEPTRFPNVVEYTITVRKATTAPQAWVLMYWEGAGWKKADQQAGIRFEDGETKTFAVDE